MTDSEPYVIRVTSATLLMVSILSILLLIAFCMYIFPTYSVWQQSRAGQAELARASANRQIAIQEAQAKKESAALLAEAEVARARGVAEANAIIGASLKENEAYLRYLWIQNLDNDQQRTIVYVPTEAGLPILEAGRAVK